MEQVQKKGAAVEELGVNLLTMLSSSIVDKFEKEFEKKGMLFTPELSEQLRKLIVESYNEIQSSTHSPLIQDVGTATPTPISEQLVEGTLPPLVFQFDHDCLVMGMMMNGKPKVVKNEKGSRSTPAYFRLSDDNGLVYGTDAEMHRDSRGIYDFWSSLQRGGPSQTFNLKEFGIFDLPALFFPALLIRKLKITAEESQCNGELGQCQAAILAVLLQTTSVDRLHLKEVALFAGFQNAYVISAEGLAAYYWFHKKETERKQNNYSKDFVIINWTWTVVVYKRSSVAGTDGKKCLAVTPIVWLYSSQFDRPIKTKQDEFVEVIRNLLKLDENAVIPVIGNRDRFFWFSSGLRTLDQNKIKSVEEDKSDPSKYFVAKGAALLSGNPENIGCQVRSMMQTVSIEPDNNKLPGILITRYDQILPETVAQQILNIKHDRRKYRIVQNYDKVGYLVINGVELDSDLQVTYTLSWEGTWKVVGVSAKHATDDDEDYKAVSWEWLVSDKVNVPQFGSSSYEECRSLLLKFVPSPSKAKVASTQGDSSGGLPLQTLNEAAEAPASVCSSVDGNGKRKMLATKSRVTLPNDMNRFKDQDNLLNKALSSPSQVKRRSAWLTKVGSNTSGLGSSQDQSVGLGSSSIDSRDANGTKEKKRSRKGMVIRKNDIVVNTGLKKIKLESDWVEPVLKIEQDLVDDFREDGNGQQVNFVEQEEEIEIEEDVVKIEAEGGGENIAD